MNKFELEEKLTLSLPEFGKHWEKEDIYKENNAFFNAHGLIRSFLHYFRGNFKKMSNIEFEKISNIIENGILVDSVGDDEVSNSICSEFLELISNEESEKLNPYLKKTCEEYYKGWLYQNR